MIEDITSNLTKYACLNDADKFANLFAEEGVYHDYIYGSFKGRDDIKVMLTNYFFRDAKNFYWKMYDHVFRDNIGYAKYRFSFTSNIPKFLGKKVVLSGMSFFRLKFGLIEEYSESVNGGIAMVQLGVTPEKMKKVFLNWYKRSLEDDPNLEFLKKS